VWERAFRAFLSTLDKEGRLQWEKAFLDGTFVPAKRGERGWASSGERRIPRRATSRFPSCWT
jgi:hypothetical protein